MDIGLPIYFNSDKTKCVINSAYIDYVIGAGMNPVIVAPGSDLDSMTEICDGLIMPGGIDLDPTFYDEDNIASYYVDPDKDKFERAVLYKFLRAGIPVFGICRGFQLIAREYMRSNPDVTNFLDYWQHVPSHSVVEDLHVSRAAYSHGVFYLTWLYGANKKETKYMFVNSMHHQALMVDKNRYRVGKDFIILAKTKRGVPKDEEGHIVEAFKIENDKVNILAVQWHPEELKDYKLIQSFFGMETQEDDQEEEPVLLEMVASNG